MFKVGDVVKYVGSGFYVTNEEDEEVKLAVETIFTVAPEDEESREWFNMDEMTVDLACVNKWPEDFAIIVRNKPEVVLNIPETTDPEVFDKFREVLERAHQNSDVGFIYKPVSANDLGVYRPNLEDRKVGKVRIELVDNGFPNALWEIAKLMGWAQSVKGYKDHDWKNLPDALSSFPAAASRHRMLWNKGEHLDPESEMLHKVHEAFNVLAELELLLTRDS